MKRRAADENSLEGAYLQNTGALRSFLRRFLDNRADVEDLMQEAFVKSLQSHRKSRIHSPRSFMFRTARNLALNELNQRAGRRTDSVADVETLSLLAADTTLNGPEKAAQVNEMLNRALDAVNRLSPRVREVFVLRRIHGMTQREIAARLGIAESTVEKHIASGLAAMARQRPDGLS